MNSPPNSTPPDAAGPAGLDAVYRELRHRIIRLELAPGTRLREQVLAKEFGVSRTPIRRILDRLAHEGLATFEAGSGASVSAVDFRALREVWALRLKVAELVGDFVKLPAPPSVLERLTALRQQLDDIDNVDTVRPLADVYDDFHQVMLDVMSNGPLRSFYDQLYARTARVFVQMLPSLDLRTEIEAIRDEIELTLVACTQPSGQQLAEVRTKHMQMLLNRMHDALTIMPTSLHAGAPLFDERSVQGP